VSETSVTRHCWDDLPRETVADGISRRFINGDQMMLTHIYLRKGAVVAKHFHPNEQFTYVLEGTLRFWIGENGADMFDVRGGEVLHIPANVPHRVEALEDTIDIDVFSPPRQDWLDGTDDYFRRQ
jgi:quercetin dioxygenase-like cupin family protein